ncbi:MAG: SH3 domain-containing protein [Albidovulum sp.]
MRNEHDMTELAGSRHTFLATVGAIFAVIGVLVPEPLQADTKRGSMTNLPLPRFVSLKAAESNVRRGPSKEHRIDWVFKMPGLPLRVTAEFEHWRRVEDSEGQGGWIYYSLLSGVRMVLFEPERTPLLTRPDPDAPVVAEAEAGVIGRLGACSLEWCQVTAGGEKGWVTKTALWGVAVDEVRE